MGGGTTSRAAGRQAGSLCPQPAKQQISPISTTTCRPFHSARHAEDRVLITLSLGTTCYLIPCLFLTLPVAWLLFLLGALIRLAGWPGGTRANPLSVCSRVQGLPGWTTHAAALPRSDSRCPPTASAAARQESRLCIPLFAPRRQSSTSPDSQAVSRTKSKLFNRRGLLGALLPKARRRGRKQQT